MAVRLKHALQKVQSYLAASGLFPGGTGIGEPTSAPGDVYGCVFMGDGVVVDVRYGSNTVQRRELVIRAYIKAFQEPRQDVEFKLDDIWATICEDLLTGTDPDLTPVYVLDPAALGYRVGYQDIGPENQKTKYRILDITVSMDIDDSSTVT